VWHIYPQHDNAHHDKLGGLSGLAEAPASLRRFHHLERVDSQPLQAR
jgi:hypothetical protein